MCIFRFGFGKPPKPNVTKKLWTLSFSPLSPHLWKPRGNTWFFLGKCFILAPVAVWHQQAKFHLPSVSVSPPIVLQQACKLASMKFRAAILARKQREKNQVHILLTKSAFSSFLRIFPAADLGMTSTNSTPPSSCLYSDKLEPICASIRRRKSHKELFWINQSKWKVYRDKTYVNCDTFISASFKAWSLLIT